MAEKFDYLRYENFSAKEDDDDQFDDLLHQVRPVTTLSAPTQATPYVFDKQACELLHKLGGVILDANLTTHDDGPNRVALTGNPGAGVTATLQLMCTFAKANNMLVIPVADVASALLSQGPVFVSAFKSFNPGECDAAQTDADIFQHILSSDKSTFIAIDGVESADFMQTFPAPTREVSVERMRMLYSAIPNRAFVAYGVRAGVKCPVRTIERSPVSLTDYRRFWTLAITRYFPQTSAPNWVMEDSFIEASYKCTGGLPKSMWNLASYIKTNRKLDVSSSDQVKNYLKTFADTQVPAFEKRLSPYFAQIRADDQHQYLRNCATLGARGLVICAKDNLDFVINPVGVIIADRGDDSGDETAVVSASPVSLIAAEAFKKHFHSLRVAVPSLRGVDLTQRRGLGYLFEQALTDVIGDPSRAPINMKTATMESMHATWKADSQRVTCTPVTHLQVPVMSDSIDVKTWTKARDTAWKANPLDCEHPKYGPARTPGHSYQVLYEEDYAGWDSGWLSVGPVDPNDPTTLHMTYVTTQDAVSDSIARHNKRKPLAHFVDQETGEEDFQRTQAGFALRSDLNVTDQVAQTTLGRASAKPSAADVTSLEGAIQQATGLPVKTGVDSQGKLLVTVQTKDPQYKKLCADYGVKTITLEVRYVVMTTRDSKHVAARMKTYFNDATSPLFPNVEFAVREEVTNLVPLRGRQHNDYSLARQRRAKRRRADDMDDMDGDPKRQRTEATGEHAGAILAQPLPPGVRGLAKNRLIGPINALLQILVRDSGFEKYMVARGGIEEPHWEGRLARELLKLSDALRQTRFMTPVQLEPFLEVLRSGENPVVRHLFGSNNKDPEDVLQLLIHALDPRSETRPPFEFLPISNHNCKRTKGKGNCLKVDFGANPVGRREVFVLKDMLSQPIDSRWCRDCWEIEEDPLPQLETLHEINGTLLVQLLRFRLNTYTCKPENIVNRVYYDLDLTLQPRNQDRISLKLYAVLCHKGNFDSGHSYALVFDDTENSWYQFVDEKVSRAPTELVLNNPDAHLLFYRPTPYLYSTEVLHSSTKECAIQ